MYKNKQKKQKQNFPLPRDVTASELVVRMEHNLRGEEPKASTSREGLPSKRSANLGSSPPKTVRCKRRAESPARKHPTHLRRSPPRKGMQSGSSKPNQKATKDPAMSHRHPLPSRGQPGGLDDPLRRGLSGAGVKWYLRFLNQGISPEEARTKADGKKTGSVADSAQEPLRGKRGNEHITPPQELVAKRSKRAAALEEGPSTSRQARKSAPRERTGTAKCATNYAGAVKQIRVAVLPKEYPLVTLSNDELTDLEEAIIDQVTIGWDYKLKFEGIHFKPGLLLLDCANPQTAEWLKEVAPKLQNWKGVELMACLGDDIPKTRNITIFIPRSAGQEHSKTLKLIDAQNEDLNTRLWKIVSSREEGNGQVLSIRVDEESAEVLIRAGHAIHYRFGRLPVHGLKKTREQHEADKEGPPPSPKLSSPSKDMQASQPAVAPVPTIPEDTESIDLSPLTIGEQSDDTLSESEEKELLREGEGAPAPNPAS